jgi:Transcription factor WhiB
MSEKEIQLPSLITEEKDTLWRKFALCKDMDTSTFFPQRGDNVAVIKMVCYGCQVRKRCAEFAIENEIDVGIYGGLGGKERAQIRTGRVPFGINLDKVLRTVHQAINNKPPTTTNKQWITRDVVKLAAERTGVPVSVIRKNIDNANDYYI